jgi:lysophospholipase L1-like esterase
MTKKNITDKNNLQAEPKKIFYVVLVLLPIIFLIAFELILRAVDYGYNTDVFIEVAPGYYGSNPKLAKKYFHNVKSVPNTINDVFKIEKPKNGFRVFVLGGSSGAGYPYMPLGSFSRYVRKRLELVYPKNEIEVVNLSMTAVNSYTIKDVLPSVLEQKPDLILIYAGHNEYYGALGVGSMENLGSNIWLVNLSVKLEQFKTYQFIRNVIKYLVKKLGKNERPSNGTLMSRMAEKKKIPYQSDIFNAGIEQFKENMSDVLEEIHDAGVPVLFSTLGSNLMGLSPFISEPYKNFPDAKIIFKDATEDFKNGNLQKAAKEYRYAKDLDMLRFRAPEKINSVIENLSEKYGAILVNSDSALNKASKTGIIGNDLMVDHLHPTLRGYQIIGKTFYEAMEKNHLLPNGLHRGLNNYQQDSLTIAQFPFSSFDSTIAAFKIKLLKDDWPFINPTKKTPPDKLLPRKNYLDSLAYDFVMAKIDWEKAERYAADYFFAHKQYDKYVKQMNILISQFPIILSYYKFAAEKLIEAEQYDAAYDFVLRKFRIGKDYFSSKWLGIINLSRGKIYASIYYLKLSTKFKENDPQVYYNLAGAYTKRHDYKHALDNAKLALKYNPKYKQAETLKSQLEKILKTIKPQTIKITPKGKSNDK